MAPSGTGPAAGRIPLGTTLDGVPVCPGTDQRGAARPQPSAGTSCTIGAVEVAPLLIRPTLSVDHPGLLYGAETATRFSTTVAGTPDYGYPEGTVSIESAQTTAVLCTATLTAGSETTDAATYTCALAGSQLPVGTSTVKAVYAPGLPSSSNPDDAYLAATSGVVTVNVAATLSSGRSMAQTVTGKGWWMVTATGAVTPYGTAMSYGTMAGKPLDAPIVSMASAATGEGYWLVAADGGVFSFGAALFHGSMGGEHLNQPVVGMAADPATGGYWLVAADGGVFSFTAPFLGSMGGLHLDQPAVGMAALATGTGYWLVASDGGVFTYGMAAFHGSAGGMDLNAPVVAMAADPVTGGYWVVAADGGVFSFAAPFYGSEGSDPPSSPVDGIVVRPSGKGYTIVDGTGSGDTFGA